MQRKQFLATAVAGAAGLLGGVPAWAQAKLGDVSFPADVTVAGQRLALNGAGMRFRFGLRIYAAALYTATPVTRNEEMIRPALAKRLQMVAQRDVRGDDFGRLFAKGMEENASKEVFSRMVNGVLRMSEMFAAGRQFAKGEVITVDNVPGTGLIVSFRGRQQGEPIREPEFSENFFKIWFGAKPADEPLRKALLGEQTSANTNIN